MATADKNIIAARLEQRMFSEGSLGKINDKDLELFRNRLVRKFYQLKVVITLEQVNTSVVEKWAKL